MIPVIASIDANGDGIISADEMEKATIALKSLDKNKDGQLTEDEMRPEFGGPNGGGPGRRDREEHEGARGEQAESVVSRLMAMDKNVDGKLSESELSGRFQSILAKADTNKDGFATKAELEAMATADAKANGATGGREGGREGGRGGREGGGFGVPNPTEAVARAMSYDVDKDGKLSAEELMKMFSEMVQGRGGAGGHQEPRRPE
jgi:Ca2+-binding EF-hand superfamily protein